MTLRAIVYRILVASPPEVIEEREVISQVIHAWNAANSFYRRAYLEAVLWETHSTPEIGDSPQGVLNRHLVDTCDILIAFFWTRLGIPTGKSESSTVEEIEEFRKAEKPVLLYFSSVPVVLENADGGQYRKLLDFKEDCQREGLVSSYGSINELREQLPRHITSTINYLKTGYG